MPIQSWMPLALLIGCSKVEVPPDFNSDEDGDGFELSVDCDDDNPNIFPSAAEVCDGIDNDCDGLIDADDADLEDGLLGYVDADLDGYGAPGIIEVCDLDTPGIATNSDDCNDSEPDIRPGKKEVCDGIDNDCDGDIDAADDGLVDGETLYVDADGDGFGRSAGSMIGCPPLEGYVMNDEDCNDDNPDFHPGTVDFCGDGIDEDCSGEADDWGSECTNLEPQDVIDDFDCRADDYPTFSAETTVTGDHISASYGTTGNWVNHSVEAGLAVKPSGTESFWRGPEPT